MINPPPPKKIKKNLRDDKLFTSQCQVIDHIHVVVGAAEQVRSGPIRCAGSSGRKEV